MNVTTDSLLATIRTAGFKPYAVHESVVVAERPIAGHPGTYRVLHFTAGRSDWRGVLLLKRPRSWTLTEWEYDPTPLSERGCLVEIEQVELWLAGALSVPLDAAEVTAIEQRAA